MSNGLIFSVRTHSPLHAGIGQSIGKVDLPIEREKHTEYPCVYATGLKGSLRSYCKHNKISNITEIFGSEDGDSRTGGVVFTELKLLLFPVRSSEGSFKWVTCNHVIERFKQNYKMVYKTDCEFDFGHMVEHEPVVGKVEPDKHIILEDFVFNLKQDNSDKKVLGYSLNDIYVVDDKVFKYLVTNATQIIARNKLDDKKISDNLWYEEALPADSVLYSFVVPSIVGSGEIDVLKTAIMDKIIQIGGNETVGYGICEFKEIEGGN